MLVPGVLDVSFLGCVGPETQRSQTEQIAKDAGQPRCRSLGLRVLRLLVRRTVLVFGFLFRDPFDRRERCLLPSQPQVDDWRDVGTCLDFNAGPRPVLVSGFGLVPCTSGAVELVVPRQTLPEYNRTDLGFLPLVLRVCVVLPRLLFLRLLLKRLHRQDDQG